MNFARLARLGFASACIHGVGLAQPAQTLKEAAFQLAAAGNYAWQQTNDTEINGRRHGDTSWGKTVVDGFTVATVGGFDAVFHGNDSAFDMKDGWRHAGDLRPEELKQLDRVPNLVRRGSDGDTARHFVYVPIHDLLRALANAATAVWEDNGVIRAEVPWEFERHLAAGTLPERATLRSTVASAVRTTRPPTDDRSRPFDQRGTFSVWVKGGIIAKYAVEFARTATATSGPRKGISSSTRSFTVEFRDVGNTRVSVDPEARALMRDQPASR